VVKRTNLNVRIEYKWKEHHRARRNIANRKRELMFLEGGEGSLKSKSKMQGKYTKVN
jgi:hypothetical protein